MTTPPTPPIPRPAGTSGAFSGAALTGQALEKRKTPPPFSLRLTFEERSQYVGVKAKDARARLGDPTRLISIPQAKAEIATRMTPMLQKHIRDTEARLQAQTTALMARKKNIVQRQRKERTELGTAQEARRVQEAQTRAQRFRKGLQGLWDRVIGNHKKITRQNQAEIQECLKRDGSEKERLIRAA